MLPGPLRVDPNTVPSTETQHTTVNTFTQPRTHTYHTDLMELPRPQCSSHTHTHANFTLGKCEACQPGSDAGTDGWRERWAMDIVAEALSIAVPENRFPFTIKSHSDFHWEDCIPKSD